MKSKKIIQENIDVCNVDSYFECESTVMLPEMEEVLKDLNVLELLINKGIVDMLIIETLNGGNRYDVTEDEWKILFDWYNRRGNEKI